MSCLIFLSYIFVYLLIGSILTGMVARVEHGRNHTLTSEEETGSIVMTIFWPFVWLFIVGCFILFGTGQLITWVVHFIRKI